MFRIESYVTPIIMEYVAKYVKNIRPEDMQLSLWEGEATLQNLDLRLDVLEEELQLPCEFLSGHVHEMTIRVPWTKITSEPIRIIINTIEFVLKLRRNKSDDGGSSASSSPQRKNADPGKKRKRPPDNQQPVQHSPGSGIVNKIINNINLECRNIILKYVEDDIVVSMNVQLLQFGAADEHWKIAMTDIHPVKVLMRKLVKVSDLTICIDKRNSAGHIEVCQEPILYRCSFEIRILRKYNTNSMETTSLTRIGIFTKSMDINIASMQFPMIRRLIDITTEFGLYNAKRLTAEQEDVSEDSENEVAASDSFLTWAWNKLPALTYEPPLIEEPPIEEIAGHLKDIGVYLEELNVTLKNSELIVDNFVGSTKRIKYTPIVRITIGGLYMEKVVNEEQNWRSMKSGITYLIVDPLGSYKADDISETALISSASLEKATAFVENSLFDEKTTTTDQKVCINFDEYMALYTDEYLLNRTPIFAFDSVEYKTTKIRDRAKQELDASTTTTTKDTHLAYRLLSSGVTFRWNQSFRQVKQIIQDLIDSYDYSGYHVDQLDTTAQCSSSSNKLPPPLMEDYDELMEYIPLCIYKFDLKNINFEIYACTESLTTQKHTHNRLPGALKQALPYFLAHIERLDGTLCRPLNVDKVVHTTCQLPEKPHMLIDACHNNYTFHMQQFSLSMVNKMRKTTIRLMHIPQIELTYSDLIQKQHWKEDKLLPLRKVEVSCELINVDFNKRNLIIAARLMNCVLSYRPYLLWKIANQAMQIVKNELEPTLHNEFRDLRIDFKCFQSYTTAYFELYSLVSHVVTYTDQCHRKNLLIDTEKGNKPKKWLSASIQLNPEGVQLAINKKESLIALAIWMEPIALYIDSVLLEFLKYQEEYDHTVEREPSSEVELQSQQYQTHAPAQTHTSNASQPLRVHTNITTSGGPPLIRRSSRNSLPTRKISHPEETIHFSSERDEKMDLETVSATPPTTATEAKPTSLWQQIKSVVVCLELGHIRLHIAEKLKWCDKKENIQCVYTLIQIPKIAMRSTNAENLSRTNLQEKFTIFTAPKDTINWVIALYGLNVKRYNCIDMDTVLPDVYTTITIVVTHKKQLEEHENTISHNSSLKETPNEVTIEAASPASQKEASSSPVPALGNNNLDRSLPITQAQTTSAEVDAITVHIDTMPIHFNVSEAKCSALHFHLGILGKVIKLIGPMAQLSASTQMSTSSPPIQIVTASEENAVIKQFLELETSSSVSSGLVENKASTTYTTSFFCQWSIAKIICELTAQERKSKMVLELEDLLSTVDKREDFTKFTGKVGQCNLLYYIPDKKEDWVAQPSLRLKMLGDITNMPYLNIVYTSVGLKSFYSRIGVKPKYDANRSIAEVIITIQAMEIIVDLDSLKEFVGSLGVLFAANECTDNCSEERPLKQVQTNPPTAADLPLIHLDSKGFTLYTPLATKRECCTVLIWKIESIKLTPNLENPLQRNPIRPDVYGKAAQLGFLNTPGSLVEDRQYELVLQNLSLSTAQWTDILDHMAQQAKTFQHTNPAVEWNTQTRETAPHITHIFTRFTFIGIFAPCIAYNNVLICGQAIEFNCASDFVAAINTDQLYAMSFMAYRVNELLDFAERSSPLRKSNMSLSSNSYSIQQKSGSVLPKPSSSLQCGELLIAPISKTARSPAAAFEPIDENTEQNVKTDSGIQSQQSRGDRQSVFATPTDALVRKFPRTVSFLAGTFTIKLYEVNGAMAKNTDGPQVKCTDKVLCLVPLLTLTASQPSFMYTQNIYDNITQMSLYNLNIHSMPSAVLDAEDTNLFPIEFIDTRPGELGPTGIPPPLITVRKHITKQKLVETDVEIARPIIITLQEQQTVVLLKNSLILYQTILHSGYLNPRALRIVQKASKITLMRNHFYDCDRLHVKLDKLVMLMKHESDYEGKLVCADMHFNATFLQRPEKAVLKAAIGSLHLQMGERIYLHPVALRSTFAFVSEPWYDLPLVSGTVKLDILDLDIDVNGLKQLQRIQIGVEKLLVRLNEEWKEFLRNRPPMGEPAEMPTEKLVALNTSALKGLISSNVSKKKLTREEFYQDDLRAGAFQFVEMATDSFLPLPYQIQIIKKNYGIICWRYPQPRKMCKIHVFPVPMAVQKPINIRCQMEYFSESHECFLHFSEFWLSETASKDIVLPEREICANIWRVVIMQSLVAVNGECFEQSEEDEDKIPSLKIEELFKLEKNDEDFILHPKVLVGCMRIDTAFQSVCVPKFQVLLSCTSLQVKFLNQANDEYKLPPALAEYTLAPSKQISQAFLVVLLENLSMHAAFNSTQIYSVDSSLTLNVKCLDYGFLNMLTVLEDATLQSYVTVNKPKRLLNINAVLEKFRINIGPSILHTLLSSKAHWQELFAATTPSQCHVLLPKCIVVNRMHALVVFGQTGTTERIQLQPLECSLYSFGNDGNSQELSFFIADNKTRITDASQSVPIPFKFDRERLLQSIRIGDKCLIIEMQKLSATQVIVFLKGQIELISMVPQELRVELRFDETKADEDKRQLEYLVKREGYSSFYAAVQRASNATMRLKMVAPKVKGRTGDIPLKQNKKLPWLVKVPTANNEFVSFWVRVIRQDITDLCSESFQPQRILVTIWPIFEIQSRLPSALTAYENTTGKQFEIEPRGGRFVLDVPATHLTEHIVEFKTKTPLNCECDAEQTLSLKSMQWNSFFWYDEKDWGIDDAFHKLRADFAPSTSKWPLDEEDELRVNRLTHSTGAANIVYATKPAREFSCATCLEVTAWAIFINATGLDIGICIGQTKERTSVKSNCLEMLSVITTPFTIDLPLEDDGIKWISSTPICFNGISPTGGSRGIVLLDNDSLDFAIVHKTEIFKLVLEYKIENSQRVLRLRPKYVVANFSNYKLELLTFAMDHKESASRQTLEEFVANSKKMDLNKVQWTENCIGQTLDPFHDLRPNRKAKRSKDTAYVCFVSVKLSDNDDFSIPISLSIPFTRRTFALQNGEDSVPLVATLIEKDRIYYLNIFEDTSPALLMTNQTDVAFIIAQTSASENSKVSNTTPEYSGRHFEWYQHVPAYSKCYYTPPELYTSFPDVESTTCNITLALYKENPTKKTLKWSKPIRTDRTWEKFLYIPNHGDVKVIVCDKHRVTRIFVYYIAQLEFSVKDLRSRLLTPKAAADADSPNSSLLSISPSTVIHDPITMRNTPDKCRHFSNECNTKTQLKVRCFIKEFIVSLHTDGKSSDSAKSEIVGLYADDALIAFDDDDDDRELHLLLPNLQLDNQNYVCGQYDFPVLLCSQELYERKPIVPPVHFLDRTYQNLRNRPLMAHFEIEFFEDEMKLHSIRCTFSPMRIYIEDSYLNFLLDAVVDCTPSNCAYHAERPSTLITLASGEYLLPRVIVGQALCIAEPLQIRQFQIEPLSVLLSVHTSIRLYIALDHSPLSFSIYNREHILTMPLRFGQSLSMHYLSGAIFGAGWVVGSLEILGSPSGLARSFTTGLRDFVSMPVEGLFRGPWGFIVGITQGSASLLRNVTAGTLNSVSKLAASVARNLDRLTLDQEHIERTEALRRRRPHGFTEGLTQGVTGLGISILGAVGGLARHTLEARTPTEVMTGVGKGLVGAVTKPLSGAAELLALTGQGVLHTVGFNTMPELRVPAICANIITEPSAYRIWKLLPGTLKSDQILFNHEVTLLTQDQLRRGYALLTSSVFALMEMQSFSLICVFPIDKVEMTSDTIDKTLYYIHLIRDKEGADEENYTNQRIITYIHSSTSLKNVPAAAAGSLSDLFQSHEQELQSSSRKQMDWAFYINETLGEHIIKYLRVMNRNC